MYIAIKDSYGNILGSWEASIVGHATHFFHCNVTTGNVRLELTENGAPAPPGTFYLGHLEAHLSNLVCAIRDQAMSQKQIADAVTSEFGFLQTLCKLQQETIQKLNDELVASREGHAGELAP